MTARTSIRASALAVLIVASWLIPRAIAGNIAFNAPPTQMIHVAASDAESQSITLGISKSVVIDLPRDIKDVLVADPKIANAVVRSSRRAYHHRHRGRPDQRVFLRRRRQADRRLRYRGDARSQRHPPAIQQVLPDADITVEGIGDGVILSGSVSSQAEAQQAFDIATRLLDAGSSEAVRLR